MTKDYPIRDVRCLQDGRIVVHQAITNNLIVFNSSFGVEKEFEGIEERYNSMICSSKGTLKNRKVLDVRMIVEDFYGTKEEDICPFLIQMRVRY